MVDYKRKPVLWIEGTRCLTNPERGVYSDLVERMYALEADLYYDERDLAGFCNLTIRSFRKILQSLIDKEKIHWTNDGKLTANHVPTERETAINVRETYRSRGSNGGKKSGESRKNNTLTEACASTSPSPSPSPSPSLTKKKKNPTDSSKKDPGSDPQFMDFWQAYPRQRRGNKAKAWQAWKRALDRAPPEAILAGLHAYANSREVAEGFAKGAQAWLNDDRWANDYKNGTVVEKDWWDKPPTERGTIVGRTWRN